MQMYVYIIKFPVNNVVSKKITAGFHYVASSKLTVIIHIIAGSETNITQMIPIPTKASSRLPSGKELQCLLTCFSLAGLKGFH